MTMTLAQIYKRLPSEKSAITFIEKIFWDNQPKCPYCHSTAYTPFKDGKRYKCNTCENSYSVTVKTLFHRTKIEIQKWIYLLLLMASGRPLPSLRKLSEEMEVTKDTVSKMIDNVRNNYLKDKVIIDKILNQISDGK